MKILNLSSLSQSAERIILPKISRHEVCNPSIIFIDEGIYAVYKGINYNLRKNGFRKLSYGGLPSPCSDSQNYFAQVEWKESLKIKKCGFLEDRHIRSHPSALNGLQDIRIFHWKNKIYALAACLTHQFLKEGKEPTTIRKTSLMLCKIQKHIITPISLLPSRQQHEKNWMPWVKNNELYFIYNNDPYEVLHFDGKTISTTTAPASHAELASQSGSTTVIPFGKNYIGIVHKKTRGYVLDNGKDTPLQSYTHTAVVYNENFDVVEVSPEFTFEGERVEFCCGVAISGKNIILSYGVWDTEAVILKMALKEFLNILSLSGIIFNEI